MIQFFKKGVMHVQSGCFAHKNNFFFYVVVVVVVVVNVAVAQAP